MNQPDLQPRHRVAIRSAVQRYERPLVAFARRYVWDLNTARDVTQDTFLRLCQQTPEQLDALFNGLDRSRLEGWLFVVARNLAIDAQRRSGKAGRLDATHHRPPMAPNPADSTAQAELADHLIAMVDALPAKQAEVLRLRFQQGLSYRGIADLTGHTVSYVGYLLHEGMKTLRTRARQQLQQKKSA